MPKKSRSTIKARRDEEEGASSIAGSWMTGAAIKIRHTSEEIKQFQDLKNTEYWKQKLMIEAEQKESAAEKQLMKEKEAAEKQNQTEKEAAENQPLVTITAATPTGNLEGNECRGHVSVDQERDSSSSSADKTLQDELSSSSTQPAAIHSEEEQSQSSLVVETAPAESDEKRASAPASEAASGEWLDDLLNFNVKDFENLGSEIDKKKENTTKRKTTSERSRSSEKTKRRRQVQESSDAPKPRILVYYPCQHCRKCFMDSANLQKHVIRFHPRSVSRGSHQRKDDERLSAVPRLPPARQGTKKRRVGNTANKTTTAASAANYGSAGTLAQSQRMKQETKSTNQANNDKSAAVGKPAGNEDLDSDAAWLYSTDDEGGTPQADVITID